MGEGDRFLRSLGIVSPAQLERLRGMKVAVAGLGMGGSIFLNLVRLGFGAFHVADPDVYERTNINRQRAAKESTVGRRKDDSLIAEARDINPEVKITAFREGVQEDNLGAFLDGVDWVVDVVDVFAMTQKLALNREAQRRGIPVASSATMGFGAAVLILMPEGPSFDSLAGIEPGMSRFDALDRFARCMFPEVPSYMRAQAELAMSGQGHIPFVVPGVEFAGAIVATEIARHVLGLGGGVVAPTGIYIDPVGLRIVPYEARATARGSLVPIGGTR